MQPPPAGQVLVLVRFSTASTAMLPMLEKMSANRYKTVLAGLQSTSWSLPFKSNGLDNLFDSRSRAFALTSLQVPLQSVNLSFDITCERQRKHRKCHTALQPVEDGLIPRAWIEGPNFEMVTLVLHVIDFHLQKLLLCFVPVVAWREFKDIEVEIQSFVLVRPMYLRSGRRKVPIRLFALQSLVRSTQFLLTCDVARSAYAARSTLGFTSNNSWHKAWAIKSIGSPRDGDQLAMIIIALWVSGKE